MNHRIQWQTASPLWSEALKDNNNTRFRQPAVLRFASDTFMEDLQATLDEKPAELKDYVLQPETWKYPAAGWLASSTTSVPKLYHPAHQRFYLATANLVCGLPGLPDKKVDAAEAEKTSFVMRRLVAKNGLASAGYDEFGWLAGQGWKKLDEPGSVEETEERMPMFAMSFCDNGRCRRLLAGFLPVTGRETYQAAPAFNPFTISEGDFLEGDPLADPQLALFTATVGEGMAELYGALNSSNAAEILDGDQAQEVFLFTLVDFAQFIQDNLAGNYSAIAGLNSTSFHSGEGLTWTEALESVGQEERVKAILDGELKTLDFLISGFSSLPAADIRQAIKNAITNLNVVSFESAGRYQLSEAYRDKVEEALADYPPEEEGEEDEAGSPSSDELGKFDAQAGALYAIRCVYDRPQCVGSANSIVSERSQSFQLAPYFDPDAPARPVRIAMPIDTSIEGLRKAPKAVSFLISDQLRNQIDRVQGVTLSSLEEGDLGSEGEWTVGMICSLSIPIITICALILLMIIIFLLNIIFWWLPFFKICLPIPVKAK